MEYRYETYRSTDTGDKVRIDICTRFEDAEHFRKSVARSKDKYNFYTEVFNNTTDEMLATLDSDESWAMWRDSLERNFAWKPEMKETWDITKDTDLQVKENYPKDAAEKGGIPKGSLNAISSQESYVPKFISADDVINPKHYQKYVDDYQWLETMCRVPSFRNCPNGFILALEMQIRKYLDRAGRKDDDLQDLTKGLWYYKFMVAYIKNGSVPILVEDVDKILAR